MAAAAPVIVTRAYLAGLVRRFVDHAAACCDSCGCHGVPTLTGAPIGVGAWELRCGCGTTTTYDLGCSDAIHAAYKADLETFIAATKNHILTAEFLWAQCPACESTLMLRLSHCSCCEGDTTSGTID